MKNPHIVAAVCFTLAVVLYSVSAASAQGLAVAGMLFELAAWKKLFRPAKIRGDLKR